MNYLGKDLFKLPKLIVSTKTPTDRWVERLECASLFVLDPRIQLIPDQRGGAGNQSRLSLPDEPGRDTMLVADEEDRAPCVKIFKDFTGKVSLITSVTPLKQKQNIRFHLQL
jgi:hypothetical protein